MGIGDIDRQKVDRDSTIGTRRGQTGDKTLVGDPKARQDRRQTTAQKHLIMPNTHHRDPQAPSSTHTRGISVGDDERRPEFPQTTEISAKTPRQVKQRRRPGHHRLHRHELKGPVSAQKIEGLGTGKEHQPMTASVELGGDRTRPSCVPATASVNKMGDDSDA